MSKNNVTVINVRLERRDDGGLRVSSSDLPGLILSGPDAEEIVGQIPVAITALLERMGIQCVKVLSATPLDHLLQGKADASYQQQFLCGQFVVELPEVVAA